MYRVKYLIVILLKKLYFCTLTKKGIDIGKDKDKKSNSIDETIQ